MLNYIKSECWRTLRSRGYFAFFGACLVLLIILNCAPTEPFNTLEFSLQFVISAIYIVPFLTICVSDLVFGNEHKGQTLKNVLAYGFT